MELLSSKAGCTLRLRSLCAASGWRQKSTVDDFSPIFPQIFHTPSSTRAQPQLSVFEPCWTPHHTCLTFLKIIISHQQLTVVTSVSRLMTSATDLTPSQHSILVTPSHRNKPGISPRIRRNDHKLLRLNHSKRTRQVLF